MSKKARIPRNHLHQTLKGLLRSGQKKTELLKTIRSPEAVLQMQPYVEGWVEASPCNVGFLTSTHSPQIVTE